MTEYVFVFCHGKRVLAHQLDGWWRCGCCGRRLYEVGKTHEMKPRDTLNECNAHGGPCTCGKHELRPPHPTRKGEVGAFEDDDPDGYYAAWV